MVPWIGTAGQRPDQFVMDRAFVNILLIHCDEVLPVAIVGAEQTITIRSRRDVAHRASLSSRTLW
jgi:hypothetical protein